VEEVNSSREVDENWIVEVHSTERRANQSYLLSKSVARLQPNQKFKDYWGNQAIFLKI
jgi:hypothetical protein